jgi:hypothetical protein
MTDTEEEKRGDFLSRRRKLIASLAGNTLDDALRAAARLPAHQAIRSLFSALCHAEPQVKWHAVSALGMVAARVAEREMEKGRTVMRRLMWNLNEESGGLGWGAPETMAEIMAVHEGLAEEYAPILVSYLRPGISRLDHPALQRGLLWGVGRLAGTRPRILEQLGAPALLPPYLDLPDPETRGLAARALGILRVTEAKKRLAALKDDPAPFPVYDGGELRTTTVGREAAKAVASL